MKVGALSLVCSLIGVLLLGWILASGRAVLYAAFGFLVFALPGIALGPAIFGRKGIRGPEWLVFGSTFGIGMSSMLAVAIGYLLRWSPGVILLGIGVLTVFCAGIGAMFRDRSLLPSPRPWKPWDYLVLAGILAVLTAFVVLPFMNVGRLTSHGYAYTWLFGYDFLVRGEYTLAMTAGFPPTALPLARETLRMYLVGYAMPAFIYSASYKTVPLQQVLLLTSLGMNVLFYGALYSFLRVFSASKRALLSTAAVLMFGYSYYWIISASKHVLLNPSATAKMQEIGRSLLQFGNVSHLFTPLVLVEPQAVLATCLLLVVLFGSELTRYEIANYRLSVFYGVALGITFGTDALWGLTAMLWFGIAYLARVMSSRAEWKRRFWLLTVAVVSAAISSGCFFWLGMYQLKSGHEMSVTPFKWFFEFAPLYFLVEFGPLFLLGIWGFILQTRDDRSKISIGLAILAAIALMEVGFLQVSVLPRTRMGDRVLPILFLVGVTYLFNHLYTSTGRKGRIRFAWVIILLAIPTYGTDIYFASNVKDVNETHYVRPADLQACQWIKQSLPASAIVQGEPEYLGYPNGYNERQDLYISLIADFAERPQILGWPYIASELIPGGKEIVKRRMKDMQAMLSATQPETLLTVARKYGINYIYVGPYEQSLHPSLLRTLRSAPQDFAEVYSVAGVHIFRCLCSAPLGVGRVIC